MALSKSPELNLALSLMGILTPLDVIEHLPRRYESFAYTERKSVYDDKERIVVLGKLHGALPHPLRFAHRTLYRFYFETNEGEVFLVEAWNRNYLSSFLQSDVLYTLSGVYEKKRHSLALVNIVKGEVAQENALRPIYSLPNPIPNHTFAALVKRSLTQLTGKIEDVIPLSYREKYRLLSREEAFRKAHAIDLMIVDTAGRLQNKSNLMAELAKMKRVLTREIPGAPHETFLIIDATTGQNGVEQAKAFKEVSDLTGIVITKMDGTSKGGIILSIRDAFGVPVRFIGLGEKMDDLEEFDLDEYLHVEKVDGEELAEVNPKLLDALEEAIRYVENPPKGLEYAIPLNHLFVVGLNETLSNVLKVMMARGFSHGTNAVARSGAFVEPLKG